MEVFDPVSLSTQENEFLLRHLGEPWSVASQDIHPVLLTNPHPKDKFPYNYPDGVVPAAVKPVIERVYELLDLEQHFEQPWVGIEAVKAAVKVYLTQAKKWAVDKTKRKAVRFPSMHTFTSKGRALRGAAGSDAGQVKTYFDEQGNRVPFAIRLTTEEAPAWAPEWMQKVADTDQPKPTDGLKVDEDKHRIECLICGHTESYREESRASFASARGRISKHLRSSNLNVDRHREAHALEFGG